MGRTVGAGSTADVCPSTSYGELLFRSHEQLSLHNIYGANQTGVAQSAWNSDSRSTRLRDTIGPELPVLPCFSPRHRATAKLYAAAARSSAVHVRGA